MSNTTTEHSTMLPMASTPSRRRARLASLAGLALIVAAGLVFAGPLDPPPGPISPTLPVVQNSIDVESLPPGGNCLHLIDKPGSYHFNQNITGASGMGGISIQAGCVTLDLNGFHLVGVPGSHDGISGDFVANKKGIVIRNGCIRGWGHQGIDMGNTATFAGIIEDIRALDNTSIGIQSGIGYIVRNCVANGNGSGIALSNGSTVIGCDSSKNLGDGFFANLGGTIQHCTAYENGGNGIQVTSGCKVLENNCRDNGLGGGSGANILAGTLNGNGRNRIDGNDCTGADIGISATSVGNFIVRNTCSGNTCNWSFVANNVYGPIINRTAPNSLAVDNCTDSAATALVSTDPWANFTN